MIKVVNGESVLCVHAVRCRAGNGVSFYLSNRVSASQPYPSLTVSLRSEPLSSNKGETGFVLDYNKLVGGLLLTQKRATLKPACKIP